MGSATEKICCPGSGCTIQAGIYAPYAGCIMLMLVCVLCMFVCMTLTCLSAVKLYEMRALMDLADARMAELKQYYESMQPGDRGSSSSVARQAAAWGAEVLGEVANGVPPDVAVQRSAARVHVSGSPHPRPAVSEAGSDVSRVSELRGFDEHGNGWVTTTEREPETAPGLRLPIANTMLTQFAGYRALPVGVRQRAHTSPPRRFPPY